MARNVPSRNACFMPSSPPLQQEELTAVDLISDNWYTAMALLSKSKGYFYFKKRRRIFFMGQFPSCRLHGLANMRLLTSGRNPWEQCVYVSISSVISSYTSWHRSNIGIHYPRIFVANSPPKQQHYRNIQYKTLRPRTLR